MTSKSQYKRLVAQGAIDPSRLEKLERLAVVVAKNRHAVRFGFPEADPTDTDIIHHIKNVQDQGNEIDNLLNELGVSGG